MTVVNFILAIEYVFLLYFLGLYTSYFLLNLISLLTLPRYMQRHFGRHAAEVFRLRVAY